MRNKILKHSSRRRHRCSSVIVSADVSAGKPGKLFISIVKHRFLMDQSILTVLYLILKTKSLDATGRRYLNYRSRQGEHSVCHLQNASFL